MQAHEESCEVCGRPIEVVILIDYAQGKPLFRRFCLECASEAEETTQAAGRLSARSRMGLGGVLITAGVLMGLAAVAGDLIGSGADGGIGWMRRVCLASGGSIAIMIGALLRVDFLAIAGSLAFGMAALSDVLMLQFSPGLGWKQMTACMFAVTMVLVGVWIRRSRHRIDHRAAEIVSA